MNMHDLLLHGASIECNRINFQSRSAIFKTVHAPTLENISINALLVDCKDPGMIRVFDANSILTRTILHDKTEIILSRYFFI